MPKPKLLRLTDFKLSLAVAIAFSCLIFFVTGADESSFFDRIFPKAAGFLRGLEYRAFDQKFILRGKVAVPLEVAVVAIDERSVNAIGRWPWPRTRVAELIKSLNHLGAAVIGLDLVFSEPDTLGNYGLLSEVVQRLEQIPSGTPQLTALRKSFEGLKGSTRSSWQGNLASLEKNELELLRFRRFLRAERERVNADRILGETVAKADNVVLGYFFLSRIEIEGLKESQYRDFSTLENSKITAFGGRYDDLERAKSIFRSSSWDFKGVRPNIHAVVGESGIQGFFNAAADGDGVYRRSPLLVYMNGEVYPSLNLQTVQTYFRKTSGEALGNIIPFFVSNDGGIEHIRSNAPYQIITDHKGVVYYNWYGPQQTIPNLSIIDILEGRVGREQVAGKAILVGPTARGIADVRTVPFGDDFPGVEMHATLVGNILQNNFLIRDVMVLLMEVLFVLIFGTFYGSFIVGRVLSSTGRTTGIVWALLLTIGLWAFIIWLDYALFFSRWHVWVRPVTPLVALFAIYFVVTLRGYVREEILKRQIKETFDIYVSPSVVNQMLDNPEKFKLGGERKELTVFFSDIRGFTTLSEQTEPEALVNFLNEYFTPMTDIVLRYEGTLDKFIGDAIMAFWGAPVAHDDHASRACHCALDMAHDLRRLQSEWQARKLPHLEIGMSINTGQVVVGNMGSQKRFSYTVIGDEVNLTSRLEGLCKDYGCQIILGSKTAWRVRSDFILRPLDRVRVKGKMMPEEIFELMGRKLSKNEAEEKSGKILQDISEIFSEALECFWARQWQQAKEGFNRVLELRREDRPAQIFLEQVGNFLKEEPAPSWDGIRILTAK